MFLVAGLCFWLIITHDSKITQHAPPTPFHFIPHSRRDERKRRTGDGDRDEDEDDRGGVSEEETFLTFPSLLPSVRLAF